MAIIVGEVLCSEYLTNLKANPTVFKLASFWFKLSVGDL